MANTYSPIRESEGDRDQHTVNIIQILYYSDSGNGRRNAVTIGKKL